MMKPILILTRGPFGQAVGEQVCQRLHGLGRAAQAQELPLDGAALAAAVARASAIAVALWRPYPQELRWLDDACFAAGVPWTMAELHGTRLTCGPVVVPGAGPCHHCFQRRWASHHPAPERELVIERAYRQDPALGPKGFVQPLVAIAASALVEDLHEPAARAGQLRLVDVLSGAVQETAVLGIHACPRCGIHHPGPTGSRFVDQLAPAIEELLS
jgi:bacteriocin biosynthesis cyclodehydratase domain-containing protein